ncbi:hypothetical protein CI102_6936 [Trichoderma harzianum]|nr:hypothetical protein CI102_6936 [Trichoderma harzianum]
MLQSLLQRSIASTSRAAIASGSVVSRPYYSGTQKNAQASLSAEKKWTTPGPTNQYQKNPPFYLQRSPNLLPSLCCYSGRQPAPARTRTTRKRETQGRIPTYGYAVQPNCRHGQGIKGSLASSSSILRAPGCRRGVVIGMLILSLHAQHPSHNRRANTYLPLSIAGRRASNRAPSRKLPTALEIIQTQSHMQRQVQQMARVYTRTCTASLEL